MRKAVAVCSALLMPALVGVAPSDFMLCFHRDGKVAVEHFQELCCTSECADERDAREGEDCAKERPAECPDDQCHDVPLTVGIEAVQQGSVVLPDLVPSISFLAADLPPQVLDGVQALPRPALHFLDLSGSPPLAHLRTVILRL